MTKKENEQLEVAPYEELTEENSSRINPTYNDRIAEFLAKCDVQMTDAQFYLYKYEDYLTGEAKSLINKYVESEPPDEHDVGMKYGSGRYILMMLIPPAGKRQKQLRGYRFRINAIYDQRRMGSDGVPPPVSPPVVVHKNDDSLVKAMTLFQGMMQNTFSMLIPLLRPPETPDYSKVVSKNMSILDDVMRNAMNNQVQLMNDFQRKMSKLPQPQQQQSGGEMGSEESNGGVMEIIAQIMPFLETWLPKLIGGGAQGKATATLIKETQLFKEIKRNRKMLSGLIKHLDEIQGIEKTDRVLNALKVVRPMALRRGYKEPILKETVPPSNAVKFQSPQRKRG